MSTLGNAQHKNRRRLECRATDDDDDVEFLS